VNDVVGWQLVSLGRLSFAGFAASQQTALCHEIGASSAVYRAVHAATTEQGTIRRVDDGVYIQLSNVASEYFYFLVHGSGI
jgi:hypothetical protein